MSAILVIFPIYIDFHFNIQFCDSVRKSRFYWALLNCYKTSYLHKPDSLLKLAFDSEQIPQYSLRKLPRSKLLVILVNLVNVGY